MTRIRYKTTNQYILDIYMGPMFSAIADNLSEGLRQIADEIEKADLDECRLLNGNAVRLVTTTVKQRIKPDFDNQQSGE